MLKKFLAGATTALLALGLVSLVAAPASAHTGDLSVTAVCNTQTKQYDVTAKLAIANTTENGSTVFKVGTSTFDHTPKSTDPAFPGTPIVSTHNPSTITLTTFSLPGSTKGLGPWIYAQTTFTPDGYFVGSDGQLTKQLDGTCGDDIGKKITICHATASSTNPWVKQMPDVNSIINGLGGHGSSGVNVDDIIPPFDYTQGGVLKHYPGNNWTGGGQQIWNAGCAVPGAPPGATYTEAVCTATGQTGNATVTIPSGITGAQYWIKSSTTGNTYATIAQGATPTFPAGTTVRVKVTPLAGYELSVKPAEFAAHTFTNVASKCVQPTAPTVGQAMCSGPGQHSTASYTIVPTGHVTYKVNGVKVTGSNDVPGALPTSVTVTVTVDSGYILVGPSSFVLAFTDPGECLKDVAVDVGFGNSVCTAPGAPSDATYTLPSSGGVTYSVTINGIPADSTPGTHIVPAKNASMVVDVTANTGWHLTSPSHNTWTYTDPGSCEKTIDYTRPTATDATCTAGDRTPGSYTLADAMHVTYNVWVNGTLTKDVDAGTYSADQGDHVLVIAVADKGWNFGDGVHVDTWKFHFTSDGLCKAYPVEPTITDQVCRVGDDGQGVYTNGVIDIPSTPGVQYTIDGVKVDAGPNPVDPGAHTVAAMALENYKLKHYTGPWTLTSQEAPACGDLPSHPIVTPQIGDPAGCAPTGTFTLGNDLGIADAVIWTVDGQPATAGSHPIAVGTSVHVHAEANGPDYGFTQGQQQDWTVGFTHQASCGSLTTLALTGGELPTGLIGGGALLLVAGVSLLSVQLLRRRRGEA